MIGLKVNGVAQSGIAATERRGGTGNRRSAIGNFGNAGVPRREVATPSPGRLLLLCFLVFSLLLHACTPGQEAAREGSDADMVMEFAESLERDSLLAQATSQYAIIAEQFPTADAYPIAVRRVAFLYAHPDNPAHDDSLALRWMRIYQPLAETREERQEVTIVTSLIQQTIVLREMLEQQTASGDSLEASARRQSRRVKDLESELQSVNEELRRLKEVDVRTSRSRRR
jgi:hypothetical protein